MVFQWVKQKLQQRKELSDRLTTLNEGIEELSPYQHATAWTESQEGILEKVRYYDKILGETVKKYGISELKDKRTREMSHKIGRLKDALLKNKRKAETNRIQKAYQPTLEQEVEEAFERNPQWDYATQGAQIHVKGEERTEQTVYRSPQLAGRRLEKEERTPAKTYQIGILRRTAVAASLLAFMGATLLGSYINKAQAEEGRSPPSYVSLTPFPAEHNDTSYDPSTGKTVPITDYNPDTGTFTILPATPVATPVSVTTNINTLPQNTVPTTSAISPTEIAANAEVYSRFLRVYQQSLARAESAISSSHAHRSPALQEAYKTTAEYYRKRVKEITQGLARIK